jgi:dihydrofolate reductase
MARVVFDISMSLDGFITAANVRPEEPLGDGGQRLHDWALQSDDDRDRRYIEESQAGLGAVICGRTTYDSSLPWWEADGPTGPLRLPLFVLTHEPPAGSPEGGVYTFVTDGIAAALERAKAAAGDKDVTVMGGAHTGREYIATGLVDEIQIHLAPVLFGGGVRMFEELDAHIELEPAETIQTAAATHLRYRVK